MYDKYQEALDNFKNLSHIRNADRITINIALLEKDSATLQELVDKETPKKITIVEGIDNAMYFCPECGSYLCEEPKLNYCSNCGQKLDWSEENE